MFIPSCLYFAALYGRLFFVALYGRLFFVALLGDSLLRRARFGERRRSLIDSLITYLITLLDYAS